MNFCKSCKSYTLKETCPKCKKNSEKAGYKFVRVKSTSAVAQEE